MFFNRLVRFFDSAKRDKESRLLIMTAEDDRFTEFGLMVRWIDMILEGNFLKK